MWKQRALKGELKPRGGRSLQMAGGLLAVSLTLSGLQLLLPTMAQVCVTAGTSNLCPGTTAFLSDLSQVPASL